MIEVLEPKWIACFEDFLRLSDPAVHERSLEALAMLDAATTMRVTSPAGTDLTVDISGAPCRGGGGILGPDDKIAYWPAGLCLCFPLDDTTRGTVVLDVGDINLTFKRYIDSPVTLTIEHDRVVSIEGDGLDAQLMRTYYEGWDDPNAYAVSHVGWGRPRSSRSSAATTWWPTWPSSACRTRSSVRRSRR